MDIGAYARRAREHADLLLHALDEDHPWFREAVRTDQHLVPALRRMDVTVSIAEPPSTGCSVAGSCDRANRGITVAQAALARMRFTALHELAHLLGDDHDEFQTALLQAGQVSRRAVEEDACEAFAAALLLPDEDVDRVLTPYGVTARGVIALVGADMASREACAVAAAQRLRAPGYVVVIDDQGLTSFAARSGDVFPIARGTAQNGGVLDALLRGAPKVTDRGALLFPGGNETPLLYVDAAAAEDGVFYAVAVTDQPDWKVLHTPDRSTFQDRQSHGWCEHCSVEFTASRRCEKCGDAVHDACGQCGCEVRPVRGERTCTECFVTKPPRCFPDDSDVCEEHPRPQ